MLNSSQNVAGAIRPVSTGVEQVTEGYYRIHLPDVADSTRVQQMMQVFEQASLEGANLRDTCQSSPFPSSEVSG